MSTQDEAARIGAGIRRVRHAISMTLQEVSDKSGVELSVISRLERGERGASVESIRAIVVDGLGMTLAKFFRALDDADEAKAS